MTDIKLNEIFSINDGLDNSLGEFINKVNVNDTVKIKILNKGQAKILSYKDLEVQSYNSYLKFILVLFIFIVFTISSNSSLLRSD